MASTSSNDAPQPSGRLSRFLETTVAKRLGQRHLVRLAAHPCADVQWACADAGVL